MTLAPHIVLVIAVAGFLIGFGKAGTAGTLGPLVTVMVALVLPADDAIGVLLPIALIGDAFSLAATWRQWDAAVLRPLLVAGLLGVGVGSLVLSQIDEVVLRRLIGAVMLVFIAWFVWSRRPRIATSVIRRFGWLSGFAAGFTSTVAHMGGPPLVIYLMSARLAPSALVGTTVVFFAAANLLKIPGYFAAGVLNVDLIAQTIWTWAAIPIGVWTGRVMVRRIHSDRFERILVALLAIGAVVLLVR